MGFNFGLAYSGNPVFTLTISEVKISSLIQGPKLFRKRVNGGSINKVEVKNLSEMDIQTNDIVMILMELLDRFSSEKSFSLDIFLTIKYSPYQDVLAQCITCLFTSLWEAKIPLKNYVICTSISLVSNEIGKDTVAINSDSQNLVNKNPILKDKCYFGTCIDTGNICYIYSTNHSNQLNQFIKMGNYVNKSLTCDIKKLIRS